MSCQSLLPSFEPRAGARRSRRRSLCWHDKTIYYRQLWQRTVSERAMRPGRVATL
jgi:hypothetical protein